VLEERRRRTVEQWGSVGSESEELSDGWPVGRCGTQFWSGFDYQHTENRVAVAIVMPVIVMAIVGAAGCQVIVIGWFGIMVMGMVAIVMMKTLFRHFDVQMATHILYRRPGDLERDEQHEKDGKDAIHGGSLAEFSSEVMPGLRSPDATFPAIVPPGGGTCLGDG